MPRATPKNGSSNRLMPRAREAIEEQRKLIKFELNYNKTRILIESDNEETLNDVLDVIKDTCGEKENALIRKLFEKK